MPMIEVQGSKKLCVQTSSQCALVLSYPPGFFLLFVYGGFFHVQQKKPAILTTPLLHRLIQPTLQQQGSMCGLQSFSH